MTAARFDPEGAIRLLASMLAGAPKLSDAACRGRFDLFPRSLFRGRRPFATSTRSSRPPSDLKKRGIPTLTRKFPVGKVAVTMAMVVGSGAVPVGRHPITTPGAARTAPEGGVNVKLLGRKMLKADVRPFTGDDRLVRLGIGYDVFVLDHSEAIDLAHQLVAAVDEARKGHRSAR